jgi:argininosuccinate lyase
VAADAADDQFMVAIDIAEELVSEGVPFRQAHEQVGRLVGEAVRSERALRDVVAETPDFERFVGLFETGVALRRRRSPGASGPESATIQHDLLASARARAGERVTRGVKATPDNESRLQ